MTNDQVRSALRIVSRALWSCVMFASMWADAAERRVTQPGMKYAWLWELLDHNGDGRLDVADEPFMPAPYRDWWHSNAKESTVLQPDDFVRLAPNIMAEARSLTATLASNEAANGLDTIRGTRASSAAKRHAALHAAESLPASHRAYDRDGDGQLTTDEWPAARFNEFAELDANHDGIITARELARPAPPIAAKSTRETNASLLPVKYRAYDRDGDGQVGLYEWPRDNLAEFEDLDANNDGLLTAAELGEPLPFLAPPDNPRQATALFADRARSVFRLADRDRDGQLSESELRASGSAAQIARLGPSYPLSADQFVSFYLRANPTNP